ncbi:DUF962-domain-containing protein [Gautieria morchelliformis]|nr:DUF962-domain-containing protein [Gautieria morchelliformis]
MSRVFDVKHQLIFYGQYHSNKYNIAIHMCFVPVIMWSAMILLAGLPTPSFFPSETYILTPYLSFHWSWVVPLAAAYAAYYLVLEPVAALLFLPAFSTMLLSADPIAATAYGTKLAAWLQALSWVAQFAGHGLAEKRAPALLDNILGAFVLAPFFVHLEVLFALGYRPQFRREIANGVGVELAKFRKEQGDIRRGKAL